MGLSARPPHAQRSDNVRYDEHSSHATGICIDNRPRQLLEFWARSLARPYMGKQISCPACNTINTVGALRCENCNQNAVFMMKRKGRRLRDLFDLLSARH